MKFSTLKLIYFSPTRTTRKILETIAQGVQIHTIEHIDLTFPETRTQGLEEIHDELAIIGAPVYAGRIPTEAIQRLKRVKATGTPAVIVVLYGNREYEDGLLELRNLVLGTGFLPFAGAAFIGEHSYATKTHPIANGRPDGEDLRKALDFGKMIMENITGIHSMNEILPLRVPGNVPYRERGKMPQSSPVTQSALCTLCEACTPICPMAAIVVKDKVMTDQNLCILCCGCVKACPTGARLIEDPRIKKLAEKLSENCRQRKEPEIYFSNLPAAVGTFWKI